MEFKSDLGKPWRYEEDGLTVTRSSIWSPPGCHPVACGLKLYVDDDGKLVKVEGDENNPITQGRLCIRCLSMLQYVYHPDRIIYPMKRDPKDRGKDKWERITWDEAIALIKEKRDYYVENFGPESMITFSGTGRQGGGFGGSAACRSLGTPNNCYTQSGYSCYAPRVVSTINLMGQAYPEIDYAGGLVDRYDDPMFQLPEVIVLWGKEPCASNPDGMFGHAVIDMCKRGSKLMVIDPRVNWQATRATWHLRLRPGTDAALGMAMVNIIVTEDLYDHEFCDKWIYGFKEFAERCQTMTPEHAAEICGIPVEEIYEATRAYANAKPASIAWGLAIDQQQNGVQAGQCILGLMAITGNIDVPGGQILADATDGIGKESKYGGKGWDKIDPDLVSEKLIGIKKYPLYCRSLFQTQADETLKQLESGEPYPLKMGWIYSSNVISCNGDEPERWYKAINSMEFNICTDVWMTPTAMGCCDLFLPLAAGPEINGVVGNHYGGSPTIEGATNKAIQVGECKSDFEITMEVGKVVNPDAWEGIETVEDWINAYGLYTIPGVDYEGLHQKVYHRRKVGYRKYETGHLRKDGQPGFETITGRMELYSLVFQQNGEDPLPYYMEPPMSPISQPEMAEKYPFVLTTGARTYAYFHSEGRQIPWLRETNPEPLVEINPKVAAEKGIRDGEWVVIENDYGKCTMVAKVTPTVDEHTIMAQHGWWMPEEDAEAPHLYGTFDHNINKLLPNGYVGKLGFGSNIKSALCNVRKLEGGEK